jgi:hypothetical protein
VRQQSEEQVSLSSISNLLVADPLSLTCSVIFFYFLGFSAAGLQPLHSTIADKWFRCAGVPKEVEIATDARLENIADGERAAASQLLTAEEVIKHPLLPGHTVLKSHMCSFDRFATVIQNNNSSDSWRLLPADYIEAGGVVKVRGKTVQGFVAKHDVVISCNGELVSFLTVLSDDKLPAGETIKLQVPAVSAT